jgi:hypothetical protein
MFRGKLKVTRFIKINWRLDIKYIKKRLPNSLNLRIF